MIENECQLRIESMTLPRGGVNDYADCATCGLCRVVGSRNNRDEPSPHSEETTKIRLCPLAESMPPEFGVEAAVDQETLRVV